MGLNRLLVFSCYIKDLPKQKHVLGVGCAVKVMNKQTKNQKLNKNHTKRKIVCTKKTSKTKLTTRVKINKVEKNLRNEKNS